MTALANTPTSAAFAWPLPTEPWDHQRHAFGRARNHSGFLLAHGMGAGKSLTAIAVLEDDKAHRVLILCPKSVVGVWPDQFAQHAARDWHIHAGAVQGARGPLRNPSVARRAEALVEANVAALRINRPFVAVVNYDACWHGDMAKVLKGTPWDVVILDESHRLKKASGKASRLSSDVAGRTRDRGGRILALTGTPMPHSPLDLWGQMRALDGGARLGTNYHQFCHYYGDGEEIWAAGGIQRTVYKGLRADRVDEFTQLIGPLMDRVDTADVLDLPPAIDTYRTVELSPKARRVYDDLEKDLIAEIDGGVVTAANAMVNVLRLAQASSGFARKADTDQIVALDGTPDKARLLADVLDELPVTEPIVVFARFHADFDAIRQVAETAGRRYGELSGRDHDGVTAQSRMRDDVDLLAVQPQSGGLGIDLTRASRAIYYSLGWELANYLQSRARVHRPGQTRTVFYTHLIVENTIDRACYGALNRREEIVGAVLNQLTSHKETMP